jgi:hypothetical protein
MATGDTFEDAKSANKPMVFLFVEKDDEATRDLIRGPKVSPLSKEKANFILVVKPAPVEAPVVEKKAAGPSITSGGKSEKKADDGAVKESVKEAAKSPVPESKLLSADFWVAYGVTAANTVVVTDWYGNEKNRFGRIPTESTLIKTVEGIAAAVEADAKALASDLEKLEKFVAGADGEAKGIKQALKMFKRGLVGHEAIAKTQEIYGKLIESGKSKLATLEAANDTSGLRSLRSAYKGTEIEGDVSEAISRVQATVSSK